MIVMVNVLFFFKQKTAYEMRISDWISDVCSSDLVQPPHRAPRRPRHGGNGRRPASGERDDPDRQQPRRGGARPYISARKPLFRLCLAPNVAEILASGTVRWYIAGPVS